MKKIFAVMMTVAVLTACNNSSEEKTETAADSSNTESPLMDAMNVRDSAGKAMEAAQDTAVKMIEAVKEK